MGVPKSHPFWWPLKKVRAMYADYRGGMTFEGVARKHEMGTSRSVRLAFATRGWKLMKRVNKGRFKPDRPKTEREIAALVAAATRLRVPDELRVEWKKWDMRRRGRFLRQLREHLQLDEMPAGSLSAGLQRFDYATPAAREIVARINAGKTSREAGCKLNLCSQGVIFEGALWFWIRDNGYVEMCQPFIPGRGRPVLHRTLYERHNGPIPEGMAVRHADGNANNFTPENLILATRDEVCRENQARALMRKSYERTAALLNLANKRKQA